MSNDARNQIKFLFLGPSSVGKTTLVKALHARTQGERHYHKLFSDARKTRTLDPTEGIAMSTAVVPHKADLTLHLWDFSGHEVYASSHPFFMTKRSVFVIVTNVNAPVQTSGIRHWIEAIQNSAPGCDIIIVGTHLDQAKHKKLFVKSWQARIFGEFKVPALKQVHCVGFKKKLNKNYDDLFEGLFNTPLLQKVLEENVPTKYFALDQELCKLKTPGHQTWQFASPLVTWKAVNRIAEECLIEPNNRTVAVKFCEELGHILYFPGIEDKKTRLKSFLADASAGLQLNSTGFIIHDLSYVTALITGILDRKNLVYAKNGLLPLGRITKNLWGALPKDAQSHFLGLLEFFDIILRIPSRELVFVPSFLDNSLPQLQKVWPAWDPEAVQIVRKYQFPFYPLGLFARFMIRIMTTYPTAQPWRNGVFIATQEAKLLVTNDQTDKSISITVRGNADSDPVIVFLSLINLLDALVEHQFQVKPQIFLPCPQCLDARYSKPTLFTIGQCEDAIREGKREVICTHETPAGAPNPELAYLGHVILIQEIAPEIVLLGLQSKQIDVGKIELGPVLGSGGFACVYKGKFGTDDVAIKVLQYEATDEEQRQAVHAEFRREVHIMTLLKHPNIVGLVGFTLQTPATMVMELMGHGDLQKFISKKPVELDWLLKLRIAIDMAHGLAFMHSRTPALVHRDFKSPNIMLKSIDRTQICAKIADFGLTKPLITAGLKGQIPSKRDVSNPTWLAPEVLEAKPSGKPVDVYAYGIVCWELVTLDLPWADISRLSDIEDAILAGTRPPLPEEGDCPAEFKNMIKACWAGEPKTRPEITAVIESHLLPMIKTYTPNFLESETVRKALSVKKHQSHLHLSSTAQKNTLRNRSSVYRKSSHLSGLFQESDQAAEGPVASLISTAESIRGKIKRGHGEKAKYLKQVTPQLFWLPYPPDCDYEPLALDFDVLAETSSELKFYNLSEKSYDYGMLHDGTSKVVEFPLSEGKVSLDTLSSCIQDILAFIQENPKNVALIHEEGKSVSKSFVVFVGVHWFSKQTCSIDAAFNEIMHTAQFDKMKVKPSQKRYLKYLEVKSGVVGVQRHLHKITFTCSPNFSFFGGCTPFWSIESCGKKIFLSSSARKKEGRFDLFCKDFVISDEVILEFFHKDQSTKMFSVQFNLNYEDFAKNNTITFTRADLDGTKTTSDNYFPSEFKIILTLITPQEMHRQIEAGKAKKPLRRLDSMFIGGIKGTSSELEESKRDTSAKRPLTSTRSKREETPALFMNSPLEPPAYTSLRRLSRGGTHRATSPRDVSPRSSPREGESTSETPTIIEAGASKSDSKPPRSSRTHSTKRSKSVKETGGDSESSGGRRTRDKPKTPREESKRGLDSSGRKTKTPQGEEMKPKSPRSHRTKDDSLEEVAAPTPTPATDPTPGVKFVPPPQPVEGPKHTEVTPPLELTVVAPTKTPEPAVVPPLKSPVSPVPIETPSETPKPLETSSDLKTSVSEDLSSEDSSESEEDDTQNCSICKTAIFPTQTSISRKVGELVHDFCLRCDLCATPFTDTACVFQGTKVFCLCCLNPKKEAGEPTKEKRKLTPEEETQKDVETELLSFMQSNLGKDHFRAYLEDFDLETLFDFHVLATERKQASQVQHIALGLEIQSAFLDTTKDTPLLDSINVTVKEARAFLKDVDLTRADAFDPYIEKCLKQMADPCFINFMKSPQHDEYQQAASTQPDLEEEEAAERRTLLADVIPLTQEEQDKSKAILEKKEQRIQEEIAEKEYRATPEGKRAHKEHKALLKEKKRQKKAQMLGKPVDPLAGPLTFSDTTPKLWVPPKREPSKEVVVEPPPKLTLEPIKIEPPKQESPRPREEPAEGKSKLIPRPREEKPRDVSPGLSPRAENESNIRQRLEFVIQKLKDLKAEHSELIQRKVLTHPISAKGLKQLKDASFIRFPAQAPGKEEGSNLVCDLEQFF